MVGISEHDVDNLILAVLIMVPSLSRFLWPCRDKFQVAARANWNAILPVSKTAPFTGFHTAGTARAQDERRRSMLERNMAALCH